MQKRPLEQKQKEGKRKWGRVAPFQAYLEALPLTASGGQYTRTWAGLPGCILSFVPIWTSHPSVISASNDKFPSNESLQSRALEWRHERLESLTESCSPAKRKVIVNLRTDAYKFREHYRTWEKEQCKLQDLDEGRAEVPEDAQREQEVREMFDISEADYYALVENAGIEPIHFPGILATWAPSGHYMPPCLLDFWRFRTLRPPEAEILDSSEWTSNEGQWRLKKQVYGLSSCAEWAAFIELSAHGDVQAKSPELW